MRFSVGAEDSQNYTSDPETIQNYTGDELCYKHTAGEDQNQYVRYAAEISGNDLDFLATLNQENGLFDPIRQSEVWTNGWREPSFGFCQIHAGYHPEIVNDERFFTDWEWQMDTCYQMYQDNVAFYGFNSRHNSYNQFTCP